MMDLFILAGGVATAFQSSLRALAEREELLLQIETLASRDRMGAVEAEANRRLEAAMLTTLNGGPIPSANYGLRSVLRDIVSGALDPDTLSNAV